MSNARALEIARMIAAASSEGIGGAYSREALTSDLDRLRDELQEADTLAGRLSMLREEVEDYRSSYHEPGDDPHDTLHEIADGCVPIYHSDAVDVLVSAPWDVLEAMTEAVAEYGPRDSEDDPFGLIRWGLYWLFTQEAHEHWRKLEEEEVTA